MSRRDKQTPIEPLSTRTLNIAGIRDQNAIMIASWRRVEAAVVKLTARVEELEMADLKQQRQIQQLENALAGALTAGIEEGRS